MGAKLGYQAINNVTAFAAFSRDRTRKIIEKRVEDAAKKVAANAAEVKQFKGTITSSQGGFQRKIYSMLELASLVTGHQCRH